MLAAEAAPAVEKAPAKVQDLVKAIATAKKMNPSDVERFLRNGGARLDLNSELRGELAADLLGRLNINVTSKSDFVLTLAQVGRLASIAAYGTFSAAGHENGEPHDDGRSDPDVAGNKGRKTRAGGNQPNSNANINAFESISDDPRE
ncbi:MAG: hypothetical protein V3U98_12615 [Acidobacteriota bacterium]